MIAMPPDDSPLRGPLRQAPWRTQTQMTSLVLATVVLVAVIGALYLAQASRTAAAGRRLQQLEAQRQQLEQQNAQLRAEIAALRSVPRLIREAEALGYRQATTAEIEYLIVRGVAPPEPEPVGRAAVDGAAHGGAAEAPADFPSYDETLESYLRDRFAGFREQAADFLANTFARREPAPGDAP